MRSLCSKRFFPLFCHSAILQNGQTFLFVLCLCRVKISNSFLFVMELHDIPSSLLWSCHPRTETDRPSEGDRPTDGRPRPSPERRRRRQRRRRRRRTDRKAAGCTGAGGEGDRPLYKTPLCPSVRPSVWAKGRKEGASAPSEKLVSAESDSSLISGGR